MVDRSFWRDRRVFVTGHTGFKGAWLCLWLHRLGSRVAGYALDPPTNPSLFDLCQIGRLVSDVRGDILDQGRLAAEMARARPEIVFHLAAQPIVRSSYLDPGLTFRTNVIGTVNVLEAVRQTPSVRVVVNVTTDKVYQNREWSWGYREIDRLGGDDPYAASKACAELVTASYRKSFFAPLGPGCGTAAAISTARAGNVIGGGDWATDRLVPDCIRALLAGAPIRIRSPRSVRPWQFVLEPILGYLQLAQSMSRKPAQFSGAWNFGPDPQCMVAVDTIVSSLCSKWPQKGSYEIDEGPHPHEARQLMIDSSKAKAELSWRPCYSMEETLSEIVDWTWHVSQGGSAMPRSLRTIEDFECATGAGQEG
jgi:CDP-glucose 4,6-dehydratase